jgi:beta-phosphoglucomutase family hydrolase
MTSNIIRAVLWDMDGVIADTADTHFKSWQYAFQQRGYIFSEEDFKHIFGQRNDAIIRRFLGDNLTQSEVDGIAKAKEEYFRKIALENLKAFPGVIHLLKQLKENDIRAAVASSGPIENILMVLKGLEIKDYFQAIVFGREVEESKPSPQIFLLAALKLGTEPDNCVVIEDATAGVTAAKRAGMKCIAVTNTHSPANLSEADKIVDSLTKISIDELNGLFNH